MKALLAICMFFVVTLVLAGEKAASIPSAATVVKGEVIEARNVESYTYLRLKTNDGEAWAAVNKTTVKQGAKVTIENVMIMKNFESKSLKKTFPTIIFGTLDSGAQGAGIVMATARSGSAKTTDTGDIHVPKAGGPNAQTVAEIMTKSTELKDRPVLVRGKVVKYNSAIMGKNWIHLRDGSGSATTNTNDILVTTTSQVKVGDVVTVKGIVRTDKDFGAGYAYKVLIDEATLQQ